MYEINIKDMYIEYVLSAAFFKYRKYNLSTILITLHIFKLFV